MDMEKDSSTSLLATKAREQQRICEKKLNIMETVTTS